MDESMYVIICVYHYVVCVCCYDVKGKYGESECQCDDDMGKPAVLSRYSTH